MKKQKEKNPTPEELLKVIRAHCLDCCGGSRRDVHNCDIKRCNLWPYRKAGRKQKEKELDGQMTIFDFEKMKRTE